MDKNIRFGSITLLMAFLTLIFVNVSVNARGISEQTTTVYETRVLLSSEDAEEYLDGTVNVDSHDLDLGFDGTTQQIVGIRFRKVEVPPGATIVKAYIQFKADEIHSEPTTLVIEAEASDSAAHFNQIENFSTRPRIEASVPWDPAPWPVIGEEGAAQQTPDISALIQGVVDQAGWAQGNSLALFISGTGKRTAESLEGDPNGAPLLHVEYAGTPLPTETPTISPTDVGSGLMFAVIGDYGKDSVNEAAVANLVNSWGPDFVITTGDNNYPDGETITIDQNIGQFYSQYIGNYQGNYGAGSPQNRFWPSLGNHDWNTISCGAVCAGAYFDYFTLAGNERYYDVNQGLVHLFAINSNFQEPDGNQSNSNQALWLKNSLASSDACFKIVYMHHSPYSSGNHGSYSTLQWPYANWGADLVISAHDHSYERIENNGFPYIVNGAGGAGLYPFTNLGSLPPGVNSVMRYDEGHGALQVIANQTSLNIRFFNVLNELIDSLAITRNCLATATPTSTPTNTPDPLATSTPSPTLDPNAMTTEIRVADSLDDAEEKPNGTVNLTSTDLELVSDKGNIQTVGMRFLNIPIPAGASINKAYIQFTVDEVSTGPNSLLVRGQLSLDPPGFSTNVGDISGRPRTLASQIWSPPDWNTVGAAEIDQRTPDLSLILQEIINQPGWTGGNDLVLIITGIDSKRTAEAWDGVSSAAPLLHVEYRPPPAATETSTPSATATETPLPTATNTPLPTATETPLPTATNTPIPTATNTSLPTATNTPLPTATNTPLPTATNTPPPTATNTPLPTATNTSLPTAPNTSLPTATTTPLPPATNTPLPTATNTSLPTATNTPLPTATNTSLPTVTNTPLPTATNTPLPTATNTPLPTATNTSLPTATNTPLPTATNTSLPTATNTPLPTATNTPLPTATNTPLPTATNTPLPTATQGPGTLTLEIQIANQEDDAEEKSNGPVNIKSTDLKMVEFRGAQTVGLRFNNLNIPHGTMITKAYIQFTAGGIDSGPITLTIQGQLSANPPAFIQGKGDISGRPRTQASVPWLPPDWLFVGESGPNQKSADISPVIQEIIALPDWTGGNSIVLIITGTTNRRTAMSWDGSILDAAMLHIEYVDPGTDQGTPKSIDSNLHPSLNRLLKGARIRHKTSH